MKFTPLDDGTCFLPLWGKLLRAKKAALFAIPYRLYERHEVELPTVVPVKAGVL